MTQLIDIVGTKSRAELFRLLFEQVARELYLREIQRRSGLSIRPIQQELARLVKSGLVLSRRDGNRTYFRANPEHSLFPEVRGLVEKTTGWRPLLSETLTLPGVQVAFVFGSVATGKAKAASDLDLMVIGSVGLRKLAPGLRKLGMRLGREINAQVMAPSEFQRKVAGRDHFVSRILESPMIFVIGDASDLKRLGQE
jgi:DNA-binding transcriptional ArsR family regulator